ncbi:MAG: ECF transporter S component [Oliverpabstia sp.]
MKTGKTLTHRICMIALAICINLVGGQIALFLKIPIYLDSIGTVFIAAVFGPLYGMIPNVVSGLLMGMTVDIYSLYYAPVGIILGLVTGLVYKKYHPKKWWILLAAVVITIPSTIVSSCITAFLFGGITSSGSSIIVQLLSRTPLGMVGSCFVVQFVTDYIDRVICLYVVAVLIKTLQKTMREKYHEWMY